MPRMLYATLPDGQRIQRKTDRTYTHVVVTLRERGDWVECSEEDAKAAGGNGRILPVFAEGGRGRGKYRYKERENPQPVRWVPKVGHGSREWSLEGWAGSQDLARKQASAVQGKHYNCHKILEVRIVPVDPPA